MHPLESVMLESVEVVDMEERINEEKVRKSDL